MGLVKYDHPPLLAPGRHYLSLADIESLCVHPFTGSARSCRERLFYALEGFIQSLLQAVIRCDAFIDGSFLTKKPEPDDVDVIVLVEHGIHITLSEDQKQVLDAINNEPHFAVGVDGFALTAYPRDHEYFGTALDGGNPGEIYGLEHSREWLKGYVVIRLWETDVRNRICR
jgi:hypothetical protein